MISSTYHSTANNKADVLSFTTLIMNNNNKNLEKKPFDRKSYEKEYQKEYRKKNSKKNKEYQKKYRKNNLEERKEYGKRWSQANQNKIKEYRKKNAERDKINQKKYREEKKEELKINKRKYVKNRRNEDILFRLICCLRSRLRSVMKYKNTKKCKKTLELTGCTLEFLYNYLELKFTKGMSWDNYGKFGWHIDHIIPCSSFDMTNPEEQKKCFHYTNLQPLWWLDNLKKSNKMF